MIRHGSLLTVPGRVAATAAVVFLAAAA